MAIKESPSASIAAEESQIAKAVLMPGDPLRAKYVADHYLEEVVCFNTVRNMLGYTGTYKGKRISVMGHGMGVPSMGIYSYELYQFFGVDTIIRIGSAGGIGDDVKVRWMSSPWGLYQLPLRRPVPVPRPAVRHRRLPAPPGRGGDGGGHGRPSRCRSGVHGGPVLQRQPRRRGRTGSSASCAGDGDGWPSTERPSGLGKRALSPADHL